MSSFIVNNETIDAIVVGAHAYRVRDCLWAHSNSELEVITRLGYDSDAISTNCHTSIGEFLLNYNAYQTNERYGGKSVHLSYKFDSRAFYLYDDGDIYGACVCLDYQLDESEDYETSGTKAFLDQIKESAALHAFAKAGIKVPYGIGGHDMTDRYKVGR